MNATVSTSVWLHLSPLAAAALVQYEKLGTDAVKACTLQGISGFAPSGLESACHCQSFAAVHAMPIASNCTQAGLQLQLLHTCVAGTQFWFKQYYSAINTSPWMRQMPVLLTHTILQQQATMSQHA